MLRANGQLLLMADADGATRFSELERLEAHFAAAKDVGAEPLFVAGSRAHLQEAAGAKRTWHRQLLMHAFHLLVALAIGDAVKDTQCGFKLFSRSAGQRLFRSLHVRRWAFDVELFFLASMLGVRVVEQPVAWTEIPGSKMRLTGMLQMAKELLMIRLLHLLGVWTVAAR